MFFTRKPWRKIEVEPVVVTVGEATLTVSGHRGIVSIKVDAPDHVKITRGGADVLRPFAEHDTGRQGAD